MDVAGQIKVCLLGLGLASWVLSLGPSALGGWASGPQVSSYCAVLGGYDFTSKSRMLMAVRELASGAVLQAAPGARCPAPVAYTCNNPRRSARRTASVRFAAPSFPLIDATWNFTV